MILRPYGIIVEGRLQIGAEVHLDPTGVITKVQPLTGPPDPYVLSPAFVNAHSHLEYRGLQGQIQETDFFPWIRAITERKANQALDQVQKDIETAAQENLAAGIAYIAEHSDRPGAAQAMAKLGLKGVIYQELITFNEQDDPDAKFAKVTALAEEQSKYGLPVHVNPHALYTVDETSLAKLAKAQAPVSIHIAESVHENPFIEFAIGPFADLHRRFGFNPPATGLRCIPYLKQLGLLTPRTQLVHACDINDQDLHLIQISGASVAHCPRSNTALNCPPAPLREMLDLRIPVGLGLDSPASSGPIDMIAEMQACLETSYQRRKPVTPEETWNLATTAGARSLGLTNWQIEQNCQPPLIRIPFNQAPHSTQDLIENQREKPVQRL